MDANHVTRKQLADLLGIKSPSYINQLLADGRAVLAPDGKHYLATESLARWQASKDPAKQGVADRHAAARAAPERADDVSDVPDAGRSSAGSSYQNARAVKEKFLALEAKRAYEVAMRQLRDAREVEGLAATAMTELRVRLEGLAATLAPRLAALGDEAAVRQLLDDELRHALDAIAHHFKTLSAQAAP